MSLTPGTKLGPYVIQAALGAGGMGEVYRAHDARLGRDVAVKVLPESVSGDPDRLRRFEQEARAAAALNHPNILAIHDIGGEDLSGPAQAGRVTYVVSELLEGQTLRELLDAGTVPVRKAIGYSVQIARGLTAAHDKSIVHRDLKPENVFVTADGRVKILDFGLAKLLEPDAAANRSHTELSALPTKAVGTTPGMVLGTVGYMAPEQVRGQVVDHRSDIFALGAILYELLAGRRAFKGETNADTLTAILKEDPADLPAAGRSIPPALVRIVDRAMEKAPAARFQSASDFAFALDALSSSSASDIARLAAVSASRPSREWLAWGTAAVLAAVAAALGWVAYRATTRPVEHATLREHLTAPDGWAFGGTPPPNRQAVSPDGKMVAFVARNNSTASDSTPRLQVWVRRLDSLTAQPLFGTEGGRAPFWSPDSRAIGFFADNKLKRIDVDGGQLKTLCDAVLDAQNAMPSGNWTAHRVILFSSSARSTVSGLSRVSEDGGDPSAVTKASDERKHTHPWLLPDGDHFLYRVDSTPKMSSELMVGSLTGGTPKLLLKDVSQAIFTQGHILYVRPGTQGEGTLMAQPFDLERLETSGDAFRLADNVASGSNGNSAFSASANGVLVFQASSLDRFSELVWIDRASGKQVGAPLGSPATYTDVRLSRDGSKAAVTIADNGQFNRNDIWIFDITRGGNPRKLTLDPADDFNPVWSPDGSEIIFTSDRKGRKLYRKASGGGPEDEIEFDDAVERASMDWSSTGTLLLATREASGPGFDLFTVPVPTRGTAAGKPAALVQSASNEVPGRYSWDGRWVAFVSNESGTPEVYVAPVSGPTGQSMKISANGGRNPVWRKDGKELYYCDNALRWIWAVEVNGDGNRFKADNPKQVAEVRMIGARQVFDATPQGERFLVSKARSNEPPPLTLVVNWLPSKR